LYAHGQRVDLVYRRVLINDMLAREGECRVLLDAYEARAGVRRPTRCACKIPHKKAFFAVLTDERHAALFSTSERALIRRHIPWTAIVEDGSVVRAAGRSACSSTCAPTASGSWSSRTTSTAGTGVTLGWETSDATGTRA
jgi:hypothetical protein